MESGYNNQWADTSQMLSVLVEMGMIRRGGNRWRHQSDSVDDREDGSTVHRSLRHGICWRFMLIEDVKWIELNQMEGGKGGGRRGEGRGEWPPSYLCLNKRVCVITALSICIFFFRGGWLLCKWAPALPAPCVPMSRRLRQPRITYVNEMGPGILSPLTNCNGSQRSLNILQKLLK